jgi:hypothetical protein
MLIGDDTLLVYCVTFHENNMPTIELLPLFIRSARARDFSIWPTKRAWDFYASWVIQYWQQPVRWIQIFSRTQDGQ